VEELLGIWLSIYLLNKEKMNEGIKEGGHFRVCMKVLLYNLGVCYE
jgi:hypothetical protein